MTIQSETYRGLIYAGKTRLACSIQIEQTGPMELTFRAGTFTSTGGESFTLPADVIAPITADAARKKAYRADLMVDSGGAVDVLVRSAFDEYPATPTGWALIHLLILDFVLPPGTVDLDDLDIFVLKVQSGFPT